MAVMTALQEHKEIIAEAMEVTDYGAGQQIYSQGETGSRFFVIREGSVTCTKTADPAKAPAVLTLNAGQYFGERALIEDEIRHGCCLSVCTCVYMHVRLPKKTWCWMAV